MCVFVCECKDKAQIARILPSKVSRLFHSHFVNTKWEYVCVCVCLLKSICIIRLNPPLFLCLLCVLYIGWFLFSRGINWPIVILVAYYMCKWCSQVDAKWNTLEFYVVALHVRWCFCYFLLLKICRCVCVMCFFLSPLSCIMSSFFAVC